jgi:hypothetical protein
MYGFCPQDQRVGQPSSKRRELACTGYSSTLKMEAVHSFKTSAIIYQNT